MSAKVEVEIGKCFSVLNSIRWVKEAGWHNKTEKEILRGFLSPFESIIFAEHFNSDNIAKGEAGYLKKCDELRGFVFEPLRRYLDAERKQANLPYSWFDSSIGTNGLSKKYFNYSQWQLPTKSTYEVYQSTGFFQRPYEDLREQYEDLREQYEDLREQYEDLREQYEDLRRPFQVSVDVPYTDVWTFPTVSNYKGKHICEKPLAMMQHIVKASTKEGNTVLDCFSGSGVTGEACVLNDRKFIGIDNDANWIKAASFRIGNALNKQPLFAVQAA
jgi:site-specific DNA-methyltransferase (adenine-specific)